MSPFHMTKWAFTAHIQSTKKRDKGLANILCWMLSTYILWYIKLTWNVQKLNVCLKMQYALQCGFHAVNFIVSEPWLFLHSPFPKRFREHTSCPAGGSVIKHMKTKALFWDSLKTLSLIYCAFGRLPRQIVHELSRSRGKWHTLWIVLRLYSSFGTCCFKTFDRVAACKPSSPTSSELGVFSPY